MLGMRRGLPSSFMRRDAEVAQDLRADAVGAQVHLAAAARGAVRAGAAAPAAAARRRPAPQLSSTATPRSLACSAASACGSGHEWSQVPASSRSITDSGSCTRTSTSSLGDPAAAVERQVQAAGCGRGRRCSRTRPARSHLARADALDQRFVAAAVLDQAGDGADLQAVLVRRTRSGRAGAPSCRRRSSLRRSPRPASGRPSPRGRSRLRCGRRASARRRPAPAAGRCGRAGPGRWPWRRAPPRPARCARGRPPRCRSSRLRRPRSRP